MVATCKHYSPSQGAVIHLGAKLPNNYPYDQPLPFSQCHNTEITQGADCVGCKFDGNQPACPKYEAEQWQVDLEATVDHGDTVPEIQRREKVVMCTRRSNNGVINHMIGYQHLLSTEEDDDWSPIKILHTVSRSHHGEQSAKIAQDLFDAEVAELKDENCEVELKDIAPKRNSFMSMLVGT